MKKYSILLLWLTALLLTGCIKEDRDDCERSFTLFFQYMGDGTKDIFKDKVKKVNLYVYNADTKQLLQTYSVDHTALTTLQGVVLNELTPGKYEAVCWGNAFDHTDIQSPDQLDKGNVAAPEFRNNQPVGTNDELYFARKEFEITRAWTAQKELLDFQCAHINMKVRLEGFNHIILVQSRSTETCPVGLQLTSLPGYTDFAGVAWHEETLYTPAVITADSEKGTYESEFAVLRYKDQNPALLKLTNPQTGSVLYSLSIEEFLKNNRLSVDKKQEAYVSILLKLNSDGISITVKPFESEDIHPGVDEKDM